MAMIYKWGNTEGLLGLLGKINPHAAVYMTWRVGRELEHTNWKAADIHEALNKVATQNGYEKRDLNKVIRIAITGSTKGASLFDSMELIGKERCLDRITALNFDADVLSFEVASPLYTESFSATDLGKD